MDIFSKKKRSEIMRRIHSKNTSPELLVRRFLYNNGYRYILHVSGLPGKPDVVLRKYKTIVLVNGCFWHGHKNCKNYRLPKSSQEYWVNKIRMNKDRDKKNTLRLKERGWYVYEIWECQLSTKQKSKDTLKSLLSHLNTGREPANIKSRITL